MAVMLKDKKIIIYNRVMEENSLGNLATKGYRPIHPGKLWAYTRQLSESERFIAAQLSTTEEVLFVINWRSGIENYMKILYKGEWFDITRIDTFEDYKQDLKIYAKTSKGGGNPNDENIFPYEEPGGKTE